MKPQSAVVLLALLLMAGSNTRATEVIDPDKDALTNLLVQDCGSCHGLRMKGGLGPSLEPERIAHIPRESLISAILDGRPGTAMPPWRALLSREQAEWMVDTLINGESIQ